MAKWGKVKDGGAAGISWYSRTLENGDTQLLARQDDAALQAELDMVKAFQNSGHDGYTKSRDIQHVGYVPPMIQQIWHEQYGIDLRNPDHLPDVLKKLNDGDWAYCRTGGGRLALK